MPPLKRSFTMVTEDNPYRKRTGTRRPTKPAPKRNVNTPRKTEAKFVDISFANYDVDANGGVHHISVIPQGDTQGERDGNQFRVTGCKINGILYGKADAALNHGMIMLVWDKQPNLNTPIIGSILNGTPYAYGERNQSYSNRFQILWRHDFAQSGTPLTGGTGSLNTANSFEKITKGIRLPEDCIAQCITSDTTGNINGRVSGALYFVVAGSSAAAGAISTTFSGKFRVYFKDM